MLNRLPLLPLVLLEHFFIILGLPLVIHMTSIAIYTLNIFKSNFLLMLVLWAQDALNMYSKISRISPPSCPIEISMSAPINCFSFFGFYLIFHYQDLSNFSRKSISNILVCLPGRSRINTKSFAFSTLWFRLLKLAAFSVFFSQVSNSLILLPFNSNQFVVTV